MASRRQAQEALPWAQLAEERSPRVRQRSLRGESTRRPELVVSLARRLPEPEPNGERALARRLPARERSLELLQAQRLPEAELEQLLP